MARSLEKGIMLIAHTPALKSRLCSEDVETLTKLGFPVEDEYVDSEMGDDEVFPGADGGDLDPLGPYVPARWPPDQDKDASRSWPRMAMVQYDQEICMDGPRKHATIQSSMGCDRCTGHWENSSLPSSMVEPAEEGQLYSGEVFLQLGEFECDDQREVAKLVLSEEEERQPSRNPCIQKAEVGFTPLKSPLQKVHNVDPAEVMENIHAWIPAIEKELGAVSHAVDKNAKRRSEVARTSTGCGCAAIAYQAGVYCEARRFP